MKKTLLIVSLLISLLGYSQTIAIQSFATGFSSPSEITHPVGDSRLFVVEQTGAIKILNPNQSVNTTPFLNLSSIISSGGERGLLGLAFHPNYATNGYFFVDYTNTAGNTVIARYSVSSNPNVALTTGTILMTITQPFANHNGGCLRFGADGFLYIAMGDGGSAGDPGNRAQNINENLGKILRIDVNATVAPFYTAPASNPYVGIAGNDEIWAIGVRNPWKFSFNATNGDMWIADVGQGNQEEINKIPNPQPGMNFGWRCYEGNATYNTAGCASSATMTFPVATYGHTGGNCSVTGGYVYTGTMYPDFANKYFFADYCVNRIGTVNASNVVAYSATLPGDNNFTTFGQDVNGEIYVASGAGTVYKIIDANLATSNFEKSGLALYPNPAKEMFKIANSNNLPLSKLTVFDISGKQLLAHTLENNSDVVSTTSLSRGMYLVVLEDVSGNSYRSKLLIE